MNDYEMLKRLESESVVIPGIDLSTQDGREKLAEIAYDNGFTWDAGKGWTE